MTETEQRAVRVQARRERRQKALELREVQKLSYREIGLALGGVSPQRAQKMVQDAEAERTAANRP